MTHGGKRKGAGRKSFLQKYGSEPIELTIRITTEQHARLIASAADSGVSVADLVRSLVDKLPPAE